MEETELNKFKQKLLKGKYKDYDFDFKKNVNPAGIEETEIFITPKGDTHQPHATLVSVYGEEPKDFDRILKEIDDCIENFK